MLSDWNFFDFSPFPCVPDDADMLITGAHLDAEEPVERTAKLEQKEKNLSLISHRRSYKTCKIHTHKIFHFYHTDITQ